MSIQSRKTKIIVSIMSLFFIFLLFFSFSILSTYFKGNVKKTEEQIVSHISEKGFFFSPNYKILTNHDNLSNVTKKQFYTFKVGDSIAGYTNNYHEFYTAYDIFHKTIWISIFILFYFIGMISTFIYFFQGTKTYNKMGLIFKINLNKRGVIRTVVIFYIIVTAIPLINISYNGIQKIIPFNQTITNAIIINTDYKKGSSRYKTPTIHLHLLYKDGSTTYISKKEVTEKTYEQIDTYISIRYKNNDPGNIFINTKHWNELLSFNLIAGVLLIITVLCTYLIIWITISHNKKNFTHIKSD